MFRCYLCSAVLISAVLGGEAEEIRRLIQQLGDDDVQCREVASNRLVEKGEPALDALRRALRSEDAEVRRRAKDIIDQIEERYYSAQILLKVGGKLTFVGPSP